MTVYVATICPAFNEEPTDIRTLVAGSRDGMFAAVRQTALRLKRPVSPEPVDVAKGEITTEDGNKLRVYRYTF